MSNVTALASWRTMRQALETATEAQCLEMLDAERKGENRATFLMRIYGRYSMLRTERERRELLGMAPATPSPTKKKD